MPRPERPLGPEDSALLGFAADLRRLREKAGKPTYRELSKQAHYSVTVLSDAASGRKLPTLAVTLAYVEACGGDAEEWRQRWHELSEELSAPPADGVRAPYLGLAAFQVEDADRFFGRDALVAELRRRLSERRFLGVFGASGSGKSSLLRAGLVARTDGRFVVFTPGTSPREECALRLAELTGTRVGQVLRDLADPAALHVYLGMADDEVLVVVDQFEEVFTLCQDDAERTWFVETLVHAADRHARVVIGVRADFYGHCGRYPRLVKALQDSQVLDRTARLWRVADSAPLSVITDSGGPINKVRFSPDNRTLVLTTNDGTTQLWNVDGPAVAAVLRSPTGTVAGLIFTPDGRRVAVTTDEGTIRFWDTDVEAAARRVCELAGTPMTREEWSARFRDRDYQPPC